ncbi:MAG: ComF family protein [Clostridia bacterium]|nr:ComF family protein [Clostridia bacterium]
MIFPKKCVFCREFISGGENVFCPVCEAKYEQMKRAFCKHCGRENALCRCVATKLRPLDIRISERHLFAYEGEFARAIIYKLKRKNAADLQKFLAHECAALVREGVRSGEKAVISYPPRAHSAVREYGFDQAQILARNVAEITQLPLAEIFCRGEGGKAQKTLTAKEREENAGKAYFLTDGADVGGKTLVIIDDVVTSGSTAARLSALAKEGGAKRIVLVSVAKT